MNRILFQDNGKLYGDGALNFTFEICDQGNLLGWLNRWKHTITFYKELK